MSRLFKIILSLLFVLLVVEIIIIAPTVVDEPADESPEVSEVHKAEDESEVEQAMQGVHLIETREGEKEWELWADEALSFKDKEAWALQQVKAVFFGNNGVTFTVTGNKGSVEVNTKNMRVEGNVVTRSSNGYVFQTETVIYNSEKRTLRSPTAVQMTGPKDAQGGRMRLKGQSMSADLNNSRMEVNKKVSAHRTFEDGKEAHIRSEQALFSGRNRMARFIGHVVIDMDSMRLTGPEARFQYDSEKDIVKSLYVSGGVRVSDVNKWATSQNVKVFFDEDKYVFKGNPRLVQNNDELRGEQIVFLDGGKKVRIQKARAKLDKERMENVN